MVLAEAEPSFGAEGAGASASSSAYDFGAGLSSDLGASPSEAGGELPERVSHFSSNTSKIRRSLCKT